MANLTLSIEDELIRRSRIVALERSTSLNELIRRYLQSLTAGEEALRKGAVEELREIWERSSARVGTITWTRDQLHDR
jgi:HEAT repeat protein